MLSRLPLTVGCWVGLLAMVIAAPLSDWTTVVTLGSGASVRVESSDGVVQQGQFLGANTDLLTITVAKRRVDIRRAEVRRLYRVSERKVGRFALRGLGIGATVETAACVRRYSVTMMSAKILAISLRM